MKVSFPTLVFLSVFLSVSAKGPVSFVYLAPSLTSRTARFFLTTAVSSHVHIHSIRLDNILTLSEAICCIIPLFYCTRWQSLGVMCVGSSVPPYCLCFFFCFFFTGWLYLNAVYVMSKTHIPLKVWNRNSSWKNVLFLFAAFCSISIKCTKFSLLTNVMNFESKWCWQVFLSIIKKKISREGLGQSYQVIRWLIPGS